MDDKGVGSGGPAEGSADLLSQDTLFSALVAAARRFGRHTAGQWEDMQPGVYDYGRLLKTTLALGRMAAKISAPGEHLGLLLPNMAATVCLLIGVSAFRRVPCMLNYTAGAAGMRDACDTAGVRTVISSRKFVEKAGLEEAVAGLGDRRVLYLEDLRAGFGIVDILWLLGFARWAPRAAVPAGDPEAPACVLFTSGSEGKPKGVVLSHRALLVNVRQVLATLPIGPADKVFNCLPIFHSFGLTAGTLLPLVSGARLLLYPSPLHYKAIPPLLGERACTVLFATGTFLHQYARHAGPDDFRHLKYVVAGAERLPEPVRVTWRERYGIDILEGYGTTETAPVLSVNVPDDNRHGSVGRLLPGIEARLLPVEGIAEGGELHVRGPNLMSGYYRYGRPGVLEPPASEAGAGWHDTGDILRIDADGFLHVSGRLKRFAKVAGEMVSLDTVEQLARTASPEAAHAASASPDPQRGEAVVLFTTDPQLSREGLAGAAQRLGIAEIAVPRRIHLLEAIPLLGSGKIDYPTLKRMDTEP